MNEDQKEILLNVVRRTVTAAVKKQPIPKSEADDLELNAHQGCFVTLKNNDNLRGCIGQFTAETPLIQLVAEMAVSSSTRDPRFLSDPIIPDELPSIEIEISVISPLEKTDDPLSLELGVHGIYIINGPRSGCFLPQVATETAWDKEQYLSYCCSHKAMLPPDAWKDPQTEVFLFTADAFSASFVPEK